MDTINQEHTDGSGSLWCSSKHDRINLFGGLSFPVGPPFRTFLFFTKFHQYYSICFFQVKSHDIYTDSKHYSVDDDNFVPDMEYSARVRSSPNLVFYQGEWSEWSSEVHWRTESAVDGESPPNRRLI